MQFVFGETHLKAKTDFMEERIRQTLKITQYFSNNFTDIPVLLGGDFNEEPQNKPICDIMESSFVDLYTLKMIQEKTLKKNQIENYPAFTTYKYREATGYQKRTIDYMFLCENNFP
jgi:endonuclease/exonuclease/phosphatase family metal-dependent hydrolase